ncbi:hypothetical protein [Streptomyces sp. NRRL B-24484]|uniref:hypothetical protein n=1 Tax=Streptomyces sp. NRRL B-24484 TaxID=1463833 RepID=UPI0004BFB53C|nr:hypothetical protein [Streptomyces sp. NRRL B-24484]
MTRRRSVQPDAQAAPLFDVLPTHARPARPVPGPVPAASSLLLLATYEQPEQPARRADPESGAGPVPSWSQMTPRQFGHAITSHQSGLFESPEHGGPGETAALF